MLLDFDRLGPLRWSLLAVGAAVVAFLLLPVLFIVALSFGDFAAGCCFRRRAGRPAGTHAVSDPGWLDSLITSVELGSWS